MYSFTVHIDYLIFTQSPYSTESIIKNANYIWESGYLCILPFSVCQFNHSSAQGRLLPPHPTIGIIFKQCQRIHHAAVCMTVSAPFIYLLHTLPQLMHQLALSTSLEYLLFKDEININEHTVLQFFNECLRNSNGSLKAQEHIL